jgi:arabinofuranosyltransferase
MGYYGLLVPDPAVTKDASSVHFLRGVTYLANFVEPYWLWVPLLLLPVLFPIAVGQRLDRADVARCMAAVGSGVLMAAYVTAIGGDYMHARMLLPATFALLLPVMLLPVPALSAQAARTVVGGFYVAMIALWAVTCGISWRIPQLPGIVPPNGISDERAFWVVTIHQRYPDDGEKFVLRFMGTANAPGSPEWLISRAERSGPPVLLYRATDGSPLVSVPLDRPGYPVAIEASLLGTGGAGTPVNGLVVDQRGLSYALGAHFPGAPAVRPGHAKTVSPAWMVADYSNATQAPGVPTAQIAAARRALSCGALAELNQATRAPLTAGRFVSNFFHSLSLTTVRFPDDPVAAEKELCG